MNGEPVKETWELIKFIATIASITAKAMRDKKIDAIEAAAILSAMTKLPDALRGIEKIPRELRDLTPAQRAALEASFADTFDIPNDRLEAAVELGVAAAFSFVQLVLLLKSEQ